MGKNRQTPGSTDTTDSTEADSTQTTDFTQQQQQPVPTGSLEAPIGDDAISEPNIINR